MEVVKKNSSFNKRVEMIAKRFYHYYHTFADDVFVSPGRVELLGNHTDHNHGQVLVSSIDLNIIALASKSDDTKVIYHSYGYSAIVVDINDLKKTPRDESNSLGMVKGVLFRLKQLGYHIGGLKISAGTSIFKGAGVSSSAAFEVLIAQMMNYYYNDNQIDKMTIARIGQFAETNYFNKPCGLLDQSGIALGGINFIDFNSLENPYIKSIRPHLENYDLVLTFTLDSHSSLTPLYAKIKDDMFLLAKHFHHEYLRQVDEKEFYAHKNELIKAYGNDVYLRGKHYFEENKRVRIAFEALNNHDEQTFIDQVNASGESSFFQLKNCYVKNINENLPQAILLSKGFLKDGAVRVHGGGFAGTIIAFVKKNQTADYITLMENHYGKNNVKKIAFSPYGTRFVCKVDEVIDKKAIIDYFNNGVKEV